MKKSKSIFFILAVFAVAMLVVVSAGIAEQNALIIFAGIILFIATFGVGFTLKKKYRENDWL